MWFIWFVGFIFIIRKKEIEIMADINFLNSFSEDTQDKLEKTMLECSMLLSLNRNSSLSECRKDMFLQCVFAIICSEEKDWSQSDVQQVFHDRFGKDFELDVIQSATQRLLNLGWLERTANGLVANPQIAKESRDSANSIKERTKTLINEIVDSVDKQMPERLSEDTRKKMDSNVKEAFNLYIRMYGFETFVNSSLGEAADIVDNEDIVKSALNGLEQQQGEALLNVLSNLLENPTNDQATTMMLWVKIYLGTQIMRLDPQLSELESANLKGKKFVLDTDFLLYCLTDHPKQSKSYQKLLKTLRHIGCQLIIPEEVVIEVVKHAQCADNNYRRFSHILKSVSEDVIEAKANNVFVKDFCLQDIRAKHHQTLKQYMHNNYLSDEDPLDFMKQLIKDKLRIEVQSDDEMNVDDDYLLYQEELTTKIYLKTRCSDKDKWRSDDETRAISETDAKLYLSILSLNKDVKMNAKEGMLRAKAYLVTFTTKSIKCAQEMNIHRNFVTRPELLINLMTEIGDYDDSKNGFVNLFDNPFLAHIIDENWDLVKNFSELGLNMHCKNITKLKEDLSTVYHKYITKDADKEVINITPDFEISRLRTAKDFFAMADEVNKLNYEFLPEIQTMVNEYKEETNRRMSAEEKQRIAEELLAKKAHGYQVYLQIIGKASRNKKNGKASRNKKVGKGRKKK